MRIALLHGWSLSGSGSNEYTRYLARALAAAGHAVHVLCREPHPEKIACADEALAWEDDGSARQLFQRAQQQPGRCTLHQLPHGPLRPVYVTDQQRQGPVRPFTALTDAEYAEFEQLYVAAVTSVLRRHPVDIVHANHIVPQPNVAAAAGRITGVPYIVYPHGSAIEYTVRPDPRFQRLARDAVRAAGGLIIGSREVKQRLQDLFPDLAAEIEGKTEIVGVGVDTSLFEPVARDQRLRSVQRLREQAPGGGKPAQLVEELQRRLAQGELEAVAAYQQAYARTLPDADCTEHLLRIPWQQGRILLFVGALTVGKGLHRLIAAMPAILARVPDAHLVIVGSGAYREVLEALVFGLDRGDRALLEALVARGHELVETHLSGPWRSIESALAQPELRALLLERGRGLREHVHFLGRLPHALLRHLFPCADVAVFPSIVPEAYPLVLMESLANGVLPAASYFSGFAEGLDALVDELGEETVAQMRLPTAAERAVAGIASRLTDLLQASGDESLRASLRAIAVARYDWHMRAAQMSAAYQRVLERHRGA